MPERPLPRTRELTVIAQDPAVHRPGAASGQKILRARVEIPAEALRPGPWGYRLQVADYDISRDIFYKPRKQGLYEDPWATAPDSVLLSDPQFHCQNVYALAMRTLARFEHALGRRVSWGFYGHHLNLVPHAFADANAFYSPEDHALLFGYFPSRTPGRTVFTSLSHDVVVHETTHALLDGLRRRFTDPSSADQAAFHEGFADVVALLSVFSLREVVKVVIDLTQGSTRRPELISRTAVRKEHLRRSGLLGLAEELGQEVTAIRGGALRRSVELPPDPSYYRAGLTDDGAGIEDEYLEPHRRGEILVAAVLDAFLEAWTSRLDDLGEISRGYLSRERVVEEGAEIADTLLTMTIRALDYTPPVHLEFSDFLSAVMTSDREVRPDDSKYRLRDRLLASFAAYGIEPADRGEMSSIEGFWEPPPTDLRYGRTHYETMRSDPDEVFRFLWENRRALELSDEAYGRVISVRPTRRIGPDGFLVREVVAEHLQTLTVEARELHRYRIRRPDQMPGDQEVTLHGGGTLIFNEYGRLKYHVYNDVVHPYFQSRRLAFLWNRGYFRRGSAAHRRFSNLHRHRAIDRESHNPEAW